VHEGRVDHTVRGGRAACKTREILERAAMGARPCRCERGCCLIRAGKAEHLMSCADQIAVMAEPTNPLAHRTCLTRCSSTRLACGTAR
jgi:hypothetical protein